MKYFISILFVISVLFSEVVVTFMDITSYDVCLIDLNSEGESNKKSSEQESAESSKDDPKIGEKDSFLLSPSSNKKSKNVNTQNLPLITHYLEIHSPPPEQK